MGNDDKPRAPITKSVLLKPQIAAVVEPKFNPTIPLHLIPQQPSQRKFLIQNGRVMQNPLNFQLGAWEKADAEKRVTLTAQIMVNLFYSEAPGGGIGVGDQYSLRLKAIRQQSFGKEHQLIVDSHSFYLSELVNFLRQFKLEDSILTFLYKDSETKEASELKRQSIVFKLLARLCDHVADLDKGIERDHAELQRAIDQYNS